MKSSLMLTLALALLAVPVAAAVPESPAPEASAPAENDKRTGLIQSRQTMQYTLYLRAGDSAAIALRGRGLTDLDLYVRDPRNRHIVSGCGSTDNETVFFRAGCTGTFKIRVVNRGYRANVFTLERL